MMRMMNIENILTEDFLRLLQDYFLVDQGNGIIDQGNGNSWRNFLVAKLSWKELRKATMIFSLNHPYSIKYMEDAVFKNRVLSSLNSSKRQLTLNLSSLQNLASIDVHNLSPDGLLGLDFSHCALHTVSNAANIHNFKFLGCFAENIKPLENIYRLNISVIRRFELGPIPGLRELICDGPSMTLLKTMNFTALHSLTIKTDQWRQIDPSQLIGLRKLEVFPENFMVKAENFLFTHVWPELTSLVINKGIATDLSNFPKLEHIACWFIDVTCPIPETLTSVILLHCDDELKKEQKEFIARLACSPVVNQLRKFGLHSFYDLGSLDEYQPFLDVVSNFSACVSSLPETVRFGKNIREITLRYKKILSPFRADNLGPNVPVLTPTELTNEMWPDKNENNRLLNLALVKFPSLQRISTFLHVRSVFLRSLPDLVDITGLEYVENIVLHGCDQLRDFSCLGKHQKVLEIVNCSHLSDADLSRFSRVPKITVASCPKITDLTPLTHNNKIVAISLQSLRDVHLLGRYYRLVNISQNNILRTVQIEGKVCELIVDDNHLYEWKYLLKNKVDLIRRFNAFYGYDTSSSERYLLY